MTPRKEKILKKIQPTSRSKDEGKKVKMEEKNYFMIKKKI